VTFAVDKDRGVLILPMDRITEVTFGDNGIADPSAPDPAPIATEVSAPQAGH
jgi:hypothetical protein